MDKYKAQAVEILKFGIRHNIEIASQADSYCHLCNELGGIKNYSNKDFYACVIIVNNDDDIKDADIKKLVEELPTFKLY